MDRASHNNISDKAIEKSTGNNTKVWAEVTTINVLPGEEVLIEIENNDATKELQKGENKISLSSHLDPSGKTAVLLTSSNLGNDVSPEVPPPLEFTDIKEAKYFKKGWWSIDEAGEKPITRAVSGMLVYFHIETSIPDNPDDEQEKVYVELYEDNEQQVSTATKKPSITAIELIDKLVIPIRLDNIKRGLRNEPDKELKLYFNCTYNEETVKLPADSNNYLMVASLIIDRYKMPGLNASGTDIADDLTYGTGLKKEGVIYSDAQINQFKIDYERAGFNEEKHGLFTNKEDLPAVVPNIIRPKEQVKDSVTTKRNRFSTIIEEMETKIDKVYVDHKTNPEDIYRQADFEAQEATKNLKAKYSKKKMYETKYGIIKTGQDLKKYHEGYTGIVDWINGEHRDDSLLFDLFKENAEFFFARGKLQGNIGRMIAKFKSNTGGIYEDPILTKQIQGDPSTDRYCMYMENYIAEKIKQNTFQNILETEDRITDFDINEDDEEIRRKKQKIKGNDITNDKDSLTTVLKKPQYSYGNWYNPKHLWKAGAGLTIATNDIWSTEVILKELRNDGEDYTCKYQITLWDHFGLDIPDLQKPFNIMPGVRETFICWFVLQHLRGYKPFVTKITFEQEFKGNINEGREERRENQKEIEEKLEKAEKKVRNKRAFDKATNPWPTGSKW